MIFMPYIGYTRNKKIKKLVIISSIILTFVGFFVVPIILPVVFPKYIETIDAIKIMSFSLIPMAIIQIYTSKFLSMEKSKFILIGVVLSLSILVPTMIIFGDMFKISGVAISFVLAMSIQALYFYLMNRRLSKGESIERK